MEIQKLILQLILLFALTGCVSNDEHGEVIPKHAKRVQVAIYDSTVRPISKNLDVYETKPPQKPYKEIALLTCEGTPKEEAPMVSAILYRARLLGADAVMAGNTSFTQDGGGFILMPRGGFGGGSDTRCVFRATAIVYQDK